MFNNIGGGVNSFSFYQIKGREMFFVLKIYRGVGGNFTEAGAIALGKRREGQNFCRFFENYYPPPSPR